MKGACLTTGESTEQTNSKMARYGSATKHMGRSSMYSLTFTPLVGGLRSFKYSLKTYDTFYLSDRRDHLTLAMIYANNEKEERMARLLRKSLTSVNII